MGGSDIQYPMPNLRPITVAIVACALALLVVSFTFGLAVGHAEAAPQTTGGVVAQYGQPCASRQLVGDISLSIYCQDLGGKPAACSESVQDCPAPVLVVFQGDLAVATSPVPKE